MQPGISFMKEMKAFEPYIHGCASAYPQRHREDLCQEGLIGLYQACRSYDRREDVPFEAYAKICIKRRMSSAFRRIGKDDGNEELDQTVENKLVQQPSSESADRLFFKEFRLTLTDMERRVLDGYLADMAYADIARDLGIQIKQVDNALTRIKKKIKLKYAD